MGSINSKLDYEKELEKFVGREDEIKTVKNLVNGKRVVGIFGMKGIGKSRFLSQAIDHIPTDAVVYKDFEIDDADDVMTQYYWLEEFYLKFGNEQELKSLRNRFPDSKIECVEGGKCVGLSCKALENEMNAAVKCLKRVQKETIILLDNIDKLISEQGVKDVLLKFIDLSSKHCHKVKIMVTSANKITKVDNFGSVTLDIIDDKAALDLLYNCVENKPEGDESEPQYDELNSENCAEKKSKDRRFNENNNVFKPENERVIRMVVKLCEGLPKAVLALGQVLTEDNFLYSPADALQLLILSRLQVLSPENAPPSDRLDEHKETIGKLNETFMNFYTSSVEQMDGNSCPVEDVIAGKAESGARMKQLFVKPLITKGLMSHKDQRLVVHGVLQECVVMLKYADNSTNAEEIKGCVMKSIKENAKRSSLEIPEEYLEDSRKLEKFLTNLPEQNTQMNEGCTGGHDTTADSEQGKYSSEIGPLAMSYKDMSLAQKIEDETKAESTRETEDTKFHPLKQTTFQSDSEMPGCVMYDQSQIKIVNQGVVSVEKRRDQIGEEGEISDSAHYLLSDVLGSLVCQPESE